MSSIKIDDLEKAIKGICSEYVHDCTEIVQEVVPELSKEAVKELKKTSPKNTGKYAKSWRQKADKSRVGASAVVFNDEYYLTHLLENGHATRNGGNVSPKVHIAPVNDMIQDKLVEEVTRKIEEIK